MDKRIIDIVEQINVLSFKLVGLVHDSTMAVESRRNLIILMPKQKKPKEGSISLRKDGRYQGRFMQEGRQRSIYALTYDKCLMRLNAAIAERDGNNQSVYTFFGWAIEFLNVYKKTAVAQNTFAVYQSYLRLYIKKGADMPLKAVKPIDLTRLLNAIEGERTRESVYNLLSGMFRQAYAEQLIAFNPMLGVKRVYHKREKGTALTVDEQAAFIQAIDGHNMRLYYLFCLFSGCRRSEALNMTAEDIDDARGLIHVRGTKTDGSNRFIPLFEAVLALLPLLPNTGKLFNFTADHVTKTFGKLCPGHRLHDLRHTFATRCLESGVPLKVVQTWLGHSTIDTTANIYADVLNDYSLSEAKKLQNVFHFDAKFDAKPPLNKDL